MTLLLLFIATILLLSVLLSKLSTHVGIPVLLAFLFLGMLFGSDGHCSPLFFTGASEPIGRPPAGSPCPLSCSPPWAYC